MGFFGRCTLSEWRQGSGPLSRDW